MTQEQALGQAGRLFGYQDVSNVEAVCHTPRAPKLKMWTVRGFVISAVYEFEVWEADEAERLIKALAETESGTGWQDEQDRH